MCKIDKDTDKVIVCYNSITEASNSTKISHANISTVIKSKSKTAGGHKWKFLKI